MYSIEVIYSKLNNYKSDRQEADLKTEKNFPILSFLGVSAGGSAAAVAPIAAAAAAATGVVAAVAVSGVRARAAAADDCGVTCSGD